MWTERDLEDWKKNNIHGMIAVKMIERLKERGISEKVYVSNHYERPILFRGREFFVDVVVRGVTVGDVPDDDDIYYSVYLGDLVVCPEFREAFFEVLRETDSGCEVSDIICLEDCCLAMGEEYKSLYDALESIFPVDDATISKMWEIFRNIGHYYDIISQYGRFYLRATDTLKRSEIINKEDRFLEDMANIKRILERNLPKLQQIAEEAKIEKNKRKQEKENK